MQDELNDSHEPTTGQAVAISLAALTTFTILLLAVAWFVPPVTW
jgi:hypothetical protein